MITLYYDILFVCSIVLAIIYVAMWHKHFDITFTEVFTLVPVANLGYVFFYHANTLNEALIGSRLIYIGGCFLQYFILLSILNLCSIYLSKWLKIALFGICVFLYVSVMTMGQTPYFYKEVSFEKIHGVVKLTKSYGIMHHVFYIVISLFLAASLAAIVYSYFKKKQVSRVVLYLLFLPDVISVMGYYAGHFLLKNIEIVPAAYILAEIMYLLIAYRVNLYDVNDTVIDSIVENSNTGFISIDMKHRYLGSNDTAKRILPALNRLYVDSIIEKKNIAGNQLLRWLALFSEDDHEFKYTVPYVNNDGEIDDRIYNVDISYLYEGKHRRGYMITLTDDTQNQKYISLLDNYNEDLQEEVSEKTQHIIEMHDNLIMSLAAMVESRDNSTGGHIKRTSVCVRILIETILREGGMNLTDEFCHNIIKAAPMHDLGKIAVDDAVLRKPGRFTDEEFEKMKHHAAEGARVIHEILKKTDDESFRILAENVAHYHHERWDGSGYPDGLKGEKIPLEARIMAIADVYDALVSKRVYKDSMSFEKADSIIMSGMGTQFDPSLEKYYVSARSSLEGYYSSLSAE